jgi:hypothetical protein
LKLPKLEHGQAVRFEWHDSAARAGWTYDPHLLRRPGQIVTIGFVVQLTGEALTVTTSMDNKGASLDDFSVPVGCIHKLEELPGDFNLNGPKEPE